MQFYAQSDISSLVEPLRELRDRISLEVPDTFIQEESIRESADQQIATLLIVWYEREYNEPEGEFLAVKSVIDRLADEVLSDKPVAVEITDDEKKLGVTQTMVKVYWDETKTAAVPPEFPEAELFVDFGDNEYEVIDDGDSFTVLRNGEVADDKQPSIAYALGTLAGHVLQDSAEANEADQEAFVQADSDFLLSVSQFLATSPMVADDGVRDLLVEFVELVTNREFPS
jgi:hypothetical protein